MGFIPSVPHLSKDLIYLEVSVSQPVNLTPPPSQENDGTCQGGHAPTPSGNQALKQSVRLKHLVIRPLLLA